MQRSSKPETFFLFVAEIGLPELLSAEANLDSASRVMDRVLSSSFCPSEGGWLQEVPKKGMAAREARKRRKCEGNPILEKPTLFSEASS